MSSERTKKWKQQTRVVDAQTEDVLTRAARLLMFKDGEGRGTFADRNARIIAELRLGGADRLAECKLLLLAMEKEELARAVERRQRKPADDEPEVEKKSEERRPPIRRMPIDTRRALRLRLVPQGVSKRRRLLKLQGDGRHCVVPYDHGYLWHRAHCKAA